MFYIGNKPVVIKENHIVVEDEEYEGTPGLWELIVSKEPKNYNDEDYENYARLMIKNNVLHQKKIQTNLEAVIVINGDIYLVQFGIIGKNMRERELLLFRVILTRC